MRAFFYKLAVYQSCFIWHPICIEESSFLTINDCEQTLTMAYRFLESSASISLPKLELARFLASVLSMVRKLLSSLILTMVYLVA